MRFLSTVAGSAVFLLTLQPAFGQQSPPPASPPSSSQQGAQQNPGSSSSKARVQGNLEVLSDTQGVDFGPYLSKVLSAIRANWYLFIPDDAKPPLLKRGKVSIQFVILPDGKAAGVQRTESSGDMGLDRAAWKGITASDPFAPLPKEFHGPDLALRLHFYYNPQKADLPEEHSAATPASTPANH